jgi:phosphatidylinositol glycan class Z
MWRRTYLLLLVIRVYFALSPSYLHPDENFQGPEVFAGKSDIHLLVSAYDPPFHATAFLSPPPRQLCFAGRSQRLADLKASLSTRSVPPQHISNHRTHSSALGRVLSYPSKLPWEFTDDKPIRSVFPTWPIYEVPISLLKWLYAESETPKPPPQFIYYVLRGVMFLLSFVLEDWAVYELVPFARQRRATVVLVASSYVTWTYQTHTFSNSLETLLVAWGLVLIRRIIENKVRTPNYSQERGEIA